MLSHLLPAQIATHLSPVLWSGLQGAGMESPAPPMATSSMDPIVPSIYSGYKNEAPLSPGQNNGTVVDTGQGFGRHLGKGRKKLN